MSGVAAWNVLILCEVFYLMGMEMDFISLTFPHLVITCVSFLVMGAGDGCNSMLVPDPNRVRETNGRTATYRNTASDWSPDRESAPVNGENQLLLVWIH